MCGIAGFSLSPRSALDRTLAAQALLAGIAERGGDAVGYAHRGPDRTVTVRKQRGGASELLDQVSLPVEATQALVHVRDYTKGHPRIEANNHPIRHGAVVGIHNGIIVNDEELLVFHDIRRHEPEMTVDSEVIFALAARARGRTRRALEQLYGSMATAWLDEERDELILARGMGRPLWLGAGKDALLFASTVHALELAERYARIPLQKEELPIGTIVAALDGRVVAREQFSPNLLFEEEPLPAVRAPRERESCLARLAALVAPAAA
jgi:glucosamine--fructose-6-phosphate aminotransferase (isomerizing)